jgi:hypothetical protein
MRRVAALSASRRETITSKAAVICIGCPVGLCFRAPPTSPMHIAVRYQATSVTRPSEMVTTGPGQPSASKRAYWPGGRDGKIAA